MGIKITLKGQNLVLTDRYFVGQGGEGSIYAKGKTAYKVYLDSKKMIPTGKIDELAVISDKRVIKPEDVILKRNKPVGYTMRYVKNTYALCQLFTKAFRDRNSLSTNICLSLARGMQDTMQHIHENDVLVVDANEMNFLVAKTFKEVYFIDVDSYQTKSYPPTAIMESIRDRHSSTFNENTDWFAWAVVTFQLLVGIHPYKGKHPSVKGLDDRMTKNISIFDKQVRVPKACLSPDVIPKVLRDWYFDVFENGQRGAPPIDLSKAVPIVAATISYVNWDAFKVEAEYTYDLEVQEYFRKNQKECVAGVKQVCLDRRRYIDFEKPSLGIFGSNVLAANIKDDKINLLSLTYQKPLKAPEIKADSLMSYDGRFYVKSGENLLELTFQGSESSPLVVYQKIGNVMENATQLFPGVAIQSMLGSYFASVFPAPNTCSQTRLPDLDGYRILDAKYDKNLLMVVGIKKGEYDRFIFNLKDGKVKESRKVKNVMYSGLNFTVLDKGICISITEQDNIEIFHQNALTKIKAITDKKIHGGMRLTSDGNKVLFFDKTKLHSITMK